jgi:hypothetical protein
MTYNNHWNSNKNVAAKTVPVKCSVEVFKASKLGGFQTRNMSKPHLGRIFKDGNNYLIHNCYTKIGLNIGKDNLNKNGIKLFKLEPNKA